MVERMTRHLRNSCLSFSGARGDRRAKAVVRAASGALFALASACFSPAPYTEHLCRECTSECPDGLVCHEQRCVRVCDATCAGDFECKGAVCLPKSGADQCPTRTVPFALCVGRPVEGAMAAPAGTSSEEPWVVIDSRLPDGVAFDPETGLLGGIPTRPEPGSLTVRQGEPGSEEVNLDVVATESCVSIETTPFTWCSGQNHTERLSASREGEFEWRLSSTVPGLAQRGNELAGRIDEPGTYPVHVELIEEGRIVDIATIQLTVDACEADSARDVVAPGQPARLAITSPLALPDGCQGAPYSAVFGAVGGEPDYEWSIASVPLGLVLNEASGELSGAPIESGDFEIAVRVDDSAGNDDEVTRALHIGVPGESCRGPGPGPVIGETECGVDGAPACERPELSIATEDLGVACAGESFSAKLEATGGGGDYRWSLVDPVGFPAPSGLVLETTGELHGVPALDAVGEHLIVVNVMSTLTDTPPTANVTLRIEPCGGLVFITDEPGSDRLFHVNPGASSPTELSEGVLGAGESVHTFAFAAGGASLAFDVRGEDGASRLYWAGLASLGVRQPAFTGPLPPDAALISYRWSLDGRYLAGAFRTSNNRTFLGVAPADGGTGSSIEVTARYVSGLFWAANRICYVAPGLIEQARGMLCHAITAEGLQSQAPLSGIFAPNEFREDLVLSGDEGYLAIFANEIHADYVLPDERATSVRHANRVFSPGLHWAAGVSTSDATVSEVVTSQGTPNVPALLARLDPCDNVDAWSLDERWLACRSGDELTLHHLALDGSLFGSARVEESAGYAGEEFRRLWAPEGQWYAYASNGELRVVSTGDATPVARLVAEGGASSSYAGLGTDPLGERIFYHHGADLEVIDTRAEFRRLKVNGDVLLPDPAQCLEAYLEEGPRFWCGAPSTPSFVFPAPGAPRVAFVDRQNQLYVADVAAGATSEATSSPRLVHDASVKCTMDSGETQCDNFVQWVPRASQ